MGHDNRVIAVAAGAMIGVVVGRNTDVGVVLGLLVAVGMAMLTALVWTYSPLIDGSVLGGGTYGGGFWGFDEPEDDPE